MNQLSFYKQSRRGFTLIELLMVISVMIILAAIVIPKLRVVTADRKIREAARVVESMFASARDDAMVNGFAGIEIVRNPQLRQRRRRAFSLCGCCPLMRGTLSAIWSRLRLRTGSDGSTDSNWQSDI